MHGVKGFCHLDLMCIFQYLKIELTLINKKIFLVGLSVIDCFPSLRVSEYVSNFL